MSAIKKGQYFRCRITDEIIAEAVSTALRQEHANVKTPITMIECVTGISADTVGKWNKHGYAPKSRHLLTLAAHYPLVLQVLCELMGMDAVWQQAVHLGIAETMRARLDERWEKWNKLSMERDKFVLIRVRVDAHIAGQLNQRQLWFLGQLQQGYKMHSGSVVDTWHVHPKTARRDLKGLLKADLIQPMKNGQPRCYELL